METIRHGGVCPRCDKPITQGVLSRVAQLADRDRIEERPNRSEFWSLVPLKELLAELLGVGPGSKRVAHAYGTLVRAGGSELSILRTLDLQHCQEIGGAVLAEAIRRMRARQVVVREGFDGEYGSIRMFADAPAARDQDDLFGAGAAPPPPPLAPVEFDLRALQALKQRANAADTTTEAAAPDATDAMAASGGTDTRKVVAGRRGAPGDLLRDLNPVQREAVTRVAGPALILAGPGTGKTKTLTTRIAYLIREHRVDPTSILALTFTNKAAEQMRRRVAALLGVAPGTRSTTAGALIATFHAFGLSLLRELAPDVGRDANFSIVDATGRTALLRELLPEGKGASRRERAALADRIAGAKRLLETSETLARDDAEFARLFDRYDRTLAAITPLTWRI